MYDALSQDLNDLAKRVVSKICCCRRKAARRLSSSHAVDNLFFRGPFLQFPKIYIFLKFNSCNFLKFTFS